MAILNIADAARAVGKARSTMYAYIENGWLSPTVDPVTGKRGIDTEELVRVFKHLAPVDGSTTPETPEDDALEQAREAADAMRDDMIVMLKDELAAAKARDARLLELLGQAQQLALPSGKEEAPPVKRGFLSRLFGG